MSAHQPDGTSESSTERDITPDPTVKDTADLSAEPRVVVSPGPQGPAASWQYRCDGCGDQFMGDDEHAVFERANGHLRDAHDGSGHVEVVRIREV
jgi:hypothetical protein